MGPSLHALRRSTHFVGRIRLQLLAEGTRLPLCGYCCLFCQFVGACCQFPRRTTANEPAQAFPVNWMQDFLYSRDQRKSPIGIAPPESRLYLCCIGGIGVPLSLFIFAATGRAAVHWFWPCFSLWLFTVFLIPICERSLLPLQLTLLDSKTLRLGRYHHKHVLVRCL